jgi:formylglycine-generating enzyme required for sulfatase activity
MGSPRREPGRRSNEAQRSVELKRPFYIGVHETTNADFRQFRAAHKSGIYKEDSLDLDRQPVARVELAGRRGLLQLAVGARRPAAGLCRAAWVAQARRAGHDRLPPADRGGVGVRGALGRQRGDTPLSLG